MKSSDANSTWIAKKLTSLLVADPHINYPTMRQVLLEKYGIVPSNDMQLSWVKRKYQYMVCSFSIKQFIKIYGLLSALF
ncbi:hypothetical protein JHK84_027787 [Glycine max]|nr:hypothetical protein JHK85_028188 [Glycine max]KAG5003521.1 hypothetical protein JHK86_027660 [Glycine max]KAG5151315.1 hypothetical protein JHK84_027787 [Glycine max]